MGKPYVFWSVRKTLRITSKRVGVLRGFKDSSGMLRTRDEIFCMRSISFLCEEKTDKRPRVKCGVFCDQTSTGLL